MPNAMSPCGALLAKSLTRCCNSLNLDRTKGGENLRIVKMGKLLVSRLESSLLFLDCSRMFTWTCNQGARTIVARTFEL